MAKLIYSAIASLHGYVGEDRKFDWTEPDEELHTFEGSYVQL